MKLHELIFTKNDCYKAGRKITPKGVMVHSTGANNPNLKRYVGPDDGLLGQNQYNNHWNMSGISKCVHAFIGKLADGSVATYQVLPWNHRGWHCGASGNNTHISFEICEDGLTDADYFGKVYREAVELTAFLCEKYKLDPMADGVVICHKEGHTRGIASNHGDVLHWFPKHGKSMDTFRRDVKSAMGEKAPTTATPESKLDLPQSHTQAKAGTYRVNSSDGVLNLRTGASADKPLVEAMATGSEVWCCGCHTGKWLYVVSASGNTGFCHSGYLEKI
jgi:hypothetical protein